MRVLALVLALLVPGTAHAQCFNLDFGTKFGTPPASYGAAAAQPGFWNEVDPKLNVTVYPLRDLGGTTSPATMRLVWPLGATYGSTHAALGVSGDDQKLLEDFWRLAGVYGYTWVVAFKDLEPGIYRVYTYCWEGVTTSGSGRWITHVSVPRGLHPRFRCGESNWTGRHVLAETFVTDVTVTANGRLRVVLDSTPNWHALNGLQLVKVAAGCPTAYTSYCDQGPVNGCDSYVFASGRPSRSNVDNFHVEALGTALGQPGLFFFGVNGRAQVPWKLGATTLCVAPPLTRVPATNSSNGNLPCSGYMTTDFANWMAQHPTAAPPPGTVVQLQAWTNSAPASLHARVLDAIEFTVEP
jgi:hypothetical protein